MGSRKYECVTQIKDRDEIQTVAAYAEEENHLEWAELELWQKGVGGEREPLKEQWKKRTKNMFCRS